MKQMIVTACCLLVVLPIVGYIVHKLDQRDKVKNNASAAIYIKNTKKNPTKRIYLRLRKFFLTAGYIDKVSRRFEILYPGNFDMIASKTLNSAGISLILCSLSLVLIYFKKPNLHNGILAILIIFVINNEVIHYLLSNAEIKLLEEMATFISDVRHNYYINRMVDDAILLSMEGLGPEMKAQAEKLYEVVSSNNLKERVISYNAMMNNKYMKMLLSLCINVIEYNDKVINGQLLFTNNLQHLKREIYIEVLKLKKLKYIFSGSVFVTIAVCIPIDAIQVFGMSMVPELESFYFGQGGVLCVGIIFLSSIMVYLLIVNLKENKRYIHHNYAILKQMERIGLIRKALDNYTDKHYGKMLTLKATLKKIGESISPRQLLLKQMLVAGVTFLLSLGVFLYIHYNNRQLIINKVTGVGEAIAITNKTQVQMISETILTYVKENKDQVISEETVVASLKQAGSFHNTLIIDYIAEIVVRKVQQYQNEFFQWYELLICLCSAAISYWVPVLMVRYKKYVLRITMEDEVNQFNSIIYMLMYIDHMTVKDILEQMELFAVVFQSSIRECINDYNSGEIEALVNLKEKETFGPFRRLVDNLIRCDQVPIDRAFDDIVTDRENYHDRRKQENEISLQKKADIAKPMSFIPAVLVTIYLLLPLLIVSLKELAGFRESLSTLGL